MPTSSDLDEHSVYLAASLIKYGATLRSDSTAAENVHTRLKAIIGLETK